MTRLVVLSLGQGNLHEGFPVVTVYIGEADNPYRMKFTASLPASPAIPELYRNWQSLYLAFSHRPCLRIGVQKIGGIEEIDDNFEIEEAYITNVSEADIHDLSQQIYKLVNLWLNSVEFRKIEQQLRTHLKPYEEIRFIVETNDYLLRRLPWHLWSFFDDYPQAEVALSASEYQQPYRFHATTKRNKIRILAIFGDSQGIDISQDRTFLEKLSTDAEIKFLVEPKLGKFNDQLWQQGCDILFFAGHSCTQEKGYLQLNQKDTITLDQFKYGLKQAISRGLRLAIFNSCDGLGLAQQLQELHIPQVIIMREPVPNVVAQEFLKHFLAEFSQGQSLYTAVRSARERLQGLEGEYPCATWLPVICQNPAEPPMVWHTERQTERVYKVGSLVASSITKQPTSRYFGSHTFSRTAKPKLFVKHRIPVTATRRLLTLVLASVLVAASIMGVRHFGILQPWDLHSYDYLMHLRPANEKPDPRLLIVTINESDIQYQIHKKMNMRWSLSDQALNQLLQKLEQYQPTTIGIDIYRDFPVDPNHLELATRMQQNQHIFTVCKVSAPNDGAPDGVSPPSEVSKERLSFSDFVADADRVVRRQLVQLTPPLESPCVAEYALSFQLAQHYLNTQGIKWDINPEKNLQIGKTVFKPLQPHSSGYQRVDAAGYQILLNYRSVPSLLNIAQKVSLKEVLNDEIIPELLQKLVKNRIVLIGVTATSSPDDWETPYTATAPDTEKQIPGVFVQAQMVSHILSAVLDGRPLMWWWSGWMEALWVWGWSLLGGIIAWRIIQPLHIGLAIVMALLTLFSICFGLFTQAGWIPLVPSSLALVSCAIVLKIQPCSHTSNSKKRRISQI
ncbi:CHASE2 domain-containing protein [Mastigocladopsis repens]|uniref:CHASE2 domain-containing protein n=1 Tax=Mastigocladopsis repens TaxID=221287 RepID=UPI0002ED4DDB|nr:CHASE2 domain-containing protein [Mastigocladopsis repens]